MSKHTPGPWTADKNQDGSFSIRPHRQEDGGMTGWQLAYIHPYREVSHYKHYGSSVEADARLIASAPELLEACKEADGWLSVLPSVMITEQMDLTWQKIQQAIAKAEGK